MNTKLVGAAMPTGRDERLGELYRLYAPGALRFAYLLTADQHVAEDIVQDAFVRLFGRFHDLRKPDVFEVYLRRTIVNLSRDRFRRLKLERDRTDRAAQSAGQVDVASQVENRELIRSAFQGLPHRQKAALILRYYADLSEQATADVLQCSVAAVKSLVTRATASLNDRMGGEST